MSEQAVPELAVALARVETRLDGLDAHLEGLATKTEVAAVATQLQQMSGWMRWLVQALGVAVLSLAASLIVWMITR